MEKLNWQALDTLRSLFLDRSDGARRKDYWSSDETLELYDQSFAQRIGWKWQAVLSELAMKVQVPKFTRILDWGCGTGIASRSVLSAFPDLGIEEVFVYDRSPKAARFAMQAIQKEFPHVQAKIWKPSSDPGPAVLLLSHVLNELDEKTLAEIKTLIAKSPLTLWVEPGTHEISRKLIAIREDFLSSKQILAPCPHQLSCPMMRPENEKHWCHNFAEPPTEVFHSAFWGSFSRTLKIDLRSLPTSFLILSSEKLPVSVSGDRVLGRVKRLKAHLELITCTQNGDLEEPRISKRNSSQEFKRLCDTDFYTTL